MSTPKMRVLLLVLSTIALLASVKAETITVEVQALIDGRDHLVIVGGRMRWRHLDYAAVGRHDGQNVPTTITTSLNGLPVMSGTLWTPEWSQPPPDIIANPETSAAFSDLLPSIPFREVSLTLQPLQARGALRIAQAPTQENGYTTIVEFDDRLPSGSTFYRAKLTFQFADKVTTARPVPEYEYSRSDTLSTIDRVRVAGETFSFIFGTKSPGSECIVSCSPDLKMWLPLMTFTPLVEGTEIQDSIQAPNMFYRSAYLPTGVLHADSFDYPISSGHINEQLSPEQNTLYPLAPFANPERGAVSPGAGWYNVQDVGSYYSTFGGLHGGEDWNKGSGTADVGEQVKVIANGQIIDIRPAHSAGASHSGYVVLVRHWLLNGDTVDSLYVHVAPDKSGGSGNTAGVIGSESDFSFQEGSPVSKGDLIGVIGAVTSPAMSPHLHFEMRAKHTIPNDLWPNDTGDGYYGPVPGAAGNRSPNITAAEVQAAFLLMQKDGIIDPSDFIDDHR